MGWNSWNKFAGRVDDALRVLEESLRARGAHEEAFASLAKLHRAAGNWQALLSVSRAARDWNSHCRPVSTT